MDLQELDRILRDVSRPGPRHYLPPGDEVYVFVTGWEEHPPSAMDWVEKPLPVRMISEQIPFISVSKHTPGMPPVKHRHEFLEVQYVYAGHCVQEINGELFEMHTGDIAILDMQTVHCIRACSDRDVLVNIVLPTQPLIDRLPQLMPGYTELGAFILNAALGNFRTPNYLVLKEIRESALSNQLNHLLCACMTPSPLQENLVMGLLKVVLTLMAQVLIAGSAEIHRTEAPVSLLDDVLKYIRTNYADCTRESTADQFGYSPSYLSHMLREQTGKTFLQLRGEARLAQAQWYLETTSYSVRKIIELCGYGSVNTFYKEYQAKYGHTPKAR